jgi:hypothetical protein
MLGKKPRCPNALCHLCADIRIGSSDLLFCHNVDIIIYV